MLGVQGQFTLGASACGPVALRMKWSATASTPRSRCSRPTEVRGQGATFAGASPALRGVCCLCSERFSGRRWAASMRAPSHRRGQAAFWGWLSARARGSRGEHLLLQDWVCCQEDFPVRKRNVSFPSNAECVVVSQRDHDRAALSDAGEEAPSDFRVLHHVFERNISRMCLWIKIPRW